MMRATLALAIAGFCLTYTGCGGGQESDLPNRVPVQVRVLYKGEPVQGANITFVPEGTSKRPALGVTDAQGSAQLRTFGENDGAIPGEYKVAVQKADVQSGADPAADVAPPADPSAPSETRTEHLLPEKYASAETSELSATVSESGENSFTFELTD